ncbi:MAG: TRAP transporter large permease subunit [Candidatus Eisenbacteria bacterium]|uniref:TRAP transporter large permease subunit n=1 Tax=Eiseniibacteriota bacterium TaxID=2212470 RepID=A0A538UDK3_UNCEI|nr:MAG: TRAP transporter large permease subunit [Candidatus Eisenbacteria bacterium]
MTLDEPQAPPSRVVAVLHRIEGAVLVLAFLLSMVLPLIDALGRPIGGLYLPGSSTYRSQLTLWLAFLGGLLATREGRHLTLSTAEVIGHAKVRNAARLFSSSVAAAVCAVLAYSAGGVVIADRQQGTLLAIGIPVWVSECIMPISLALIALRLAWGAADRWNGRAIAFGAIAATFSLGLSPAVGHALTLPILAVIVVAALVGAPVFVAMGGVALVMFFRDGVPVAAVTGEIYRLMVSPSLPAIPLLTACGYVLAESNAATRLVRFFRALFGWMPGGIAILVAAVCALFTTFTGGSGVTIIALGGLLYPILRNEGYEEGFSLGLVTASGSLGLLLPPSLPVILYSVVANVPADSLYLAGLVPGVLLIVIVALYGMRVGGRAKARRQAFSPREAVLAGWGAKWELSVPLLVVVLFATGLATIVEASAVAFAYAIVVECFITRDIHPVRGLPGVLLKAGVLCGSVLILLASALGVTSWLVDAQIPDALLATVRTHIHSPHVFLLILNVVLLVLGSVLEIYSAIIILAPLVAPIGAAFGIDPVHLGVVFLANLELGFLFPPVGLNLLLSSSRFDKPLPQLYRHVVPFLLILGIGVLMITYLPQMTTGILRLLGK